MTLNNKLGLENHNEGCADLEAEKEQDTESEVRLGNDQPKKLQNSQTLNDLSTKLSFYPQFREKS